MIKTLKNVLRTPIWTNRLCFSLDNIRLNTSKFCFYEHWYIDGRENNLFYCPWYFFSVLQNSIPCYKQRSNWEYLRILGCIWRDTILLKYSAIQSGIQTEPNRLNFMRRRTGPRIELHLTGGIEIPNPNLFYISETQPHRYISEFLVCSSLAHTGWVCVVGVGTVLILQNL